jgi:serine/threonine-protein kinase
MALVGGSSDWRSSKAQADREYETAFRQAGFGEVHDDPEVVTTRLKASVVRGEVVAALDDWAVCATDPRRRNWLLEVARLADPDPTGWRNRARDPATWHDPVVLGELVRTVPEEQQAVRLLAVLAARLFEANMRALAPLEKVQQKYPGDFWPNLTLGTWLRVQNRQGESIRYFQAALALRPGSAAVCNDLGTALAGSGRTNEAIAHFREAIRLKPGFARAHGNLGSALRRQRRYPEAIDHFRQALRLDPGNANYHNNLGFALAVTERVDEAIDCYRQALRLDSKCGAGCNLGAALASKGRRDEAIDHFKRALHDPTYAADAHTGFGYALQSWGQRNEAIGHFRQAIRLRPGYALAHFHLAGCLRDAGRPDDAISHYERVLALVPGEPMAKKELRNILLGLGRGEEVCFAWRKELAAEPPGYDPWDGYAELCLFLGRAAEYRRARKKLLERFGSSADPRVAERVGRACLFLPASQDELRQATRLIDRALASERAKPGWLLPYFRFTKALAEYRAGNLENALTLLDADTQRILVPAPRLLLAMVQHRLGKADAARGTFRAAVASFDWDAKSATEREA